MANVYSLKGEKVGTVKLGEVFKTPLRADLIRKVVVSQQSNKRKRYGADPLAGKRTSAHYHGSSHVYGRAKMAKREMARMSRIHGEGPLLFVARFVPQAVKGRECHPPVAEKDWSKDLNKKEKKLAIMSAIAASANKDIVLKRGHKVEALKEIPLVLVDDFEQIDKTKDAYGALVSLGLVEELERSKEKKVRQGIGTMRGRRYKKKKGPLVIVSKKCELQKAARNIAGLDISTVDQLNAELLAPGAHAGRLTVWTKSAIEQVGKWK
ncbi:MAG: 50S ribosomal protein L4 [Candidatus Aenigmarchaeota archaeon]|nr:50S ribosomal protein L4 [Candidatus Aenigmarchaeota archaeon]